MEKRLRNKYQKKKFGYHHISHTHIKKQIETETDIFITVHIMQSNYLGRKNEEKGKEKKSLKYANL